MPTHQEKQEIFLLKLIFHWRFHFSWSQGGIDLILAGAGGGVAIYIEVLAWLSTKKNQPTNQPTKEQPPKTNLPFLSRQIFRFRSWSLCCLFSVQWEFLMWRGRRCRSPIYLRKLGKWVNSDFIKIFINIRNTVEYVSRETLQQLL